VCVLASLERLIDGTAGQVVGVVRDRRERDRDDHAERLRWREVGVEESLCCLARGVASGGDEVLLYSNDAGNTSGHYAAGDPHRVFLSGRSVHREARSRPCCPLNTPAQEHRTSARLPRAPAPRLEPIPGVRPCRGQYEQSGERHRSAEDSRSMRSRPASSHSVSCTIWWGDELQPAAICWNTESASTPSFHRSRCSTNFVTS
jgi:hypothetical protein